MNYKIIGAGLTGSVIARYLADRGDSVEVIDRRNHIGGNLYDYTDDGGVLVQKYGIHAFHTEDPDIYEYVKKYEEWRPYSLKCGAVIDGVYSPTPFNFSTIDTFFDDEYAAELRKKLKQQYPERESVPVTELLENGDEDIRKYAGFLFEKDYAPYTAKQWGISPDEIDPSVLKRVPVRLSYKDGYFDDEYQMLPVHSYSRFFDRLLDSDRISVVLETDALEHMEIENSRITWDGKNSETVFIYTGALDELFGHEYGKLPYRSLEFRHCRSEKDSIQDAPLVAYPQAEGYTRVIEFSRLDPGKAGGSSYAFEYPVAYTDSGSMEPYYPVLTENSIRIHGRYRALADKVKNLVCCGRLADFRYYDMDEAIANALMVCETL